LNQAEYTEVTLRTGIIWEANQRVLNEMKDVALTENQRFRITAELERIGEQVEQLDSLDRSDEDEEEVTTWEAPQPPVYYEAGIVGLVPDKQEYGIKHPNGTFLSENANNWTMRPELRYSHKDKESAIGFLNILQGKA